ncbi:unnamed protein product, partial [Thlaspi arvense]
MWILQRTLVNPLLVLLDADMSFLLNLLHLLLSRGGAKAAFSNSHVPAALSVVSTIKTQESMNDHIDALCKQRFYREAMEAFDFSQNNSSFKITLKTYVSLICACSSSRSLAQGRKIHDHILKSNCKHDTILNNHILSMYGKCGSLRDARQVFDSMPQRNLVSYTSVITGYSQNGQEAEAISLYLKMLQEGLVPDQYSFGSIIKACASSGDVGLGKQLHAQVIKLEPTNPMALCQGMQIHSFIIKYGLLTDLSVCNSLLTMYNCCSDLYCCFRMFEDFRNKADSVSWNAVLTACMQHEQPSEVLRLFKLMLLSECEPDHITMGSLLRACVEISSLRLGSQ